MLGDLLGQDTSYVYKFYNDNTKENLIEIEANGNNTINTIKYIDLDKKTTTNNEASTAMMLYHNPSVDVLNILFTDEFNGIKNIQICSMNGSLIYSKSNIESQKVEVDVKDWPSGQYYIVVGNERNQKYLSFIKQ